MVPWVILTVMMTYACPIFRSLFQVHVLGGDLSPVLILVTSTDVPSLHSRYQPCCLWSCR